MKEWGAIIIGVAFAAAVIIGFFMGKVPLDVFGLIATAAILWFFREKQHAKEIKALLEELKSKHDN